MQTEWTLDNLEDVVDKLGALLELNAEYVLERRLVEKEGPKRIRGEYHLQVTSTPKTTNNS